MDRRQFLASGAALLAGGCAFDEPHSMPLGAMLTTSHGLGHLMRDGGSFTVTEKRRVPIAIVGGGIAGLSAAWRLARSGVRDFEIYELEARPGGNSAWGENEVSAYPWGAHYIPLPTEESRSTRELLADLGVLTGDPHAATPRYEERALCHAPQERHFRNGSWEEGIAPLAGRSPSELAEWDRFQARMRAFREARGGDGRRAFAIPLEFSSRDAEYLALDRLTMAQWLRAEGFVTEAVHWLANYGCRDDYGCDYSRVSAWAGIHYFACRSGTARDADPETVLTWPEGNGYVVKKLIERGKLAIRPRALVYSLREERGYVTLGIYLADERRAIEVEAEHVIWAAPLAFASHAFGRSGNADERLVAALRSYDYAPWVVANVTLSEPPYLHHGAPLCWDNVLYDSASLGYVVATHQGLRSRPGPTVLTWYLPLTRGDTREARKSLLASGREPWVNAALADLEKPHPEIRDIVQRVDVFANGHGMVLPRPGTIWGDARRRITAPARRVHFAHADASGLSLFEEANHRGVVAAERVLA